MQPLEMIKPEPPLERAGIELLAGEVHVWLWTPGFLCSAFGRASGPECDPDRAGDTADGVAAPPEALSNVLDADEILRFRRYLRDTDRMTFLAAHLLARTALSRYCDMEPHQWRFRNNEHGRPEPEGGPPGLRFNISHSEGVVVVIVHDGTDAGVDVEATGRVADLFAVADDVFSLREQTVLAQAVDTGECFTRFWALKESYIKARGMGLALPLREFWFDADDPAGITIGFGGMEDDPRAWSFTVGRWGDRHLVATSCRGPRHRRYFSPVDDWVFGSLGIDSS